MQINDAKGNLIRVSLIENSPHSSKPENEEGMKVNFKDWIEVKVNGIHGIAGELEIFRGKINLFTELGLGRQFVYFFVIGNRIHQINFIASSENFSELKPFFEETMQRLLTK